MNKLALNTKDPDLWSLHYHNPKLAVELSANRKLRNIESSKESVLIKLRKLKNEIRQLPKNHPSLCYYRNSIHKLEQKYFHIKRIYRTCGKSSFFVTLTLEGHEYSDRQLISFFTKLLYKLNRKLFGSKKKHLYLTGFVILEGHTKFGQRCEKHFHAFFYAPTPDCPSLEELTDITEKLILPNNIETPAKSKTKCKALPAPISDYQNRQIFDSVKIRQLGDSAHRTIDYACKNLCHPEVMQADPEFGLGLYEIRKGKLNRL